MTFGAVITGRMKLSTGVLYVAAQLAGAVIGALLVKAAVVGQFEGNLGAHALNLNVLDGVGAGVLVEAVLTFILVFTVFATAMDPRGMANLAPIAIGLAVLVDHFRAVDGRLDEPGPVLRARAGGGLLGGSLGVLAGTAHRWRPGCPRLLPDVHVGPRGGVTSPASGGRAAGGTVAAGAALAG